MSEIPAALWNCRKQKPRPSGRGIVRLKTLVGTTSGLLRRGLAGLRVPVEDVARVLDGFTQASRGQLLHGTVGEGGIASVLVHALLIPLEVLELGDVGSEVADDGLVIELVLRLATPDRTIHRQEHLRAGLVCLHTQAVADGRV